MLHSMTGFGKGTVEAPGLTVTAEIKTLNSKSTDLYCRLPRSLSHREIELRNLLQSSLERGKIELNVTTQKTGVTEAGLSVNRPLVKAYFDELHAAAAEASPNLMGDALTMSELFRLALTLPNAYLTEAADEGETEGDWVAVQGAVRLAIAECQRFRQREGAVVEAMFRGAIEVIEERLRNVTAQDELRIPAVRERLRKAVTDLVQDEAFDTNRFEQELVYYVEKYDISEEKVRLQTHLDYFREVIEQEGSGKKLNFLAQEIGREINTIGSKANDATIQRYVVEMKDELEKIKEQTANVL